MTPLPRVRELETLLAKMRNASTVQLNYDAWDRWGSAHAAPEEAATWSTDFANATRERDAAKAALEALVASSAPEERRAWAEAHEAFLTAFLEDCDAEKESEGTAAFVAKSERSLWAEVRAGTRAFVEENVFYVTIDLNRYRRLFGIDPQTLEPTP